MADLYRVTSQRQVRVPDERGNFMDAIEITFSTESADGMTEVIPKALYSREYVEELLTRTAQTLEEVASL